MRLTLNIWRQKGPTDKGQMVPYSLDNVSEHMSFLEMLDVLNERLIAELQAQGVTARASSVRLASEIEVSAAALAALREELAQKDGLLESEDKVLSVDRERLREMDARLKSLEVNLAEQTSQTLFSAYVVLDSVTEQVRQPGVTDQRSFRAAMSSRR